MFDYLREWQTTWNASYACLGRTVFKFQNEIILKFENLMSSLREMSDSVEPVQSIVEVSYSILHSLISVWGCTESVIAVTVIKYKIN